MEANEALLKDDRHKKSGVVVIEKFELQPERNASVYFRRQVLGAVAMVALCILGSMVSGYSGILLPQLKQPNSVIKIAKSDESWIAAMAPLQMAVGCVFGAWTMDKFGRKRSNIGSTLLALIGWTTIHFSTTLTTLLVGRVMCGLYVGLSGMTTTAYLAEMSSTQYRGVFMSLVAFGIAAGVFVVHLLGTFLTWQTTALVATCLPVAILATLLYLPESHVWHLNRNDVDEARRSFAWFRGERPAEIDEFDSMVRQSAGPKRTQLETLAECRRQEFYRPLLILFLFFVTTQVSGTNVVTFYSVQLMQMTVPSLDEYAATMIVDSARVAMSVVASALTKRCRVRVLLFVSAVGTVASLFALSVFVHLGQTHPENKFYATIPLVCLMTYILFISIGLVPLPWTVCGEILPSVTKGIGGGVACAVNFFAFFVVVKTSPNLFDALGTHGTFALYGVLVGLGTVGLYYVLPETKNRSLQEIQDYFKPRQSQVYQTCKTDIGIKK